MIDEYDKLPDLPTCSCHNASVVFPLGIDPVFEHLNKDIVIIVLVALDAFLNVSLSELQVHYRRRGIVHVVPVFLMKLPDFDRAGVVRLLDNLFCMVCVPAFDLRGCR